MAIQNDALNDTLAEVVTAAASERERNAVAHILRIIDGIPHAARDKVFRTVAAYYGIHIPPPPNTPRVASVNRREE